MKIQSEIFEIQCKIQLKLLINALFLDLSSYTFVRNVGEVFLVSEHEREAFVTNFSLAINQFYRNKEGEEVNKTEWHQSVVNVVTFFTFFQY